MTTLAWDVPQLEIKSSYNNIRVGIIGAVTQYYRTLWIEVLPTANFRQQASSHSVSLWSTEKNLAADPPAVHERENTSQSSRQAGKVILDPMTIPFHWGFKATVRRELESPYIKDPQWFFSFFLSSWVVNSSKNQGRNDLEGIVHRETNSNARFWNRVWATEPPWQMQQTLWVRMRASKEANSGCAQPTVALRIRAAPLISYLSWCQWALIS